MKLMLETQMVLCRTLIIWAVLAFSFGQAFAGSIVIEPDQLGDLKEQRNELDKKIKVLDNIGKQIDTVRAEKSAIKATIRRQEAEYKEARTELEDLQKIDRERPGVLSPTKLNATRDRNNQAFNALKDAKEQDASADARINSLASEGGAQYSEFLRLQKSFERDVGRVVDGEVDKQIRILQVSKDVEVTVRVACGEDKLTVCKERSKKAAELQAIERGSVVFVNSFTEIKNFKLSKEELRSEVGATLANATFKQKLLDTEQYETTINASVVPAISDTLREQLAGAVRSEVYSMVGGRIDFSQVQNPSKHVSSAQEVVDEEEEAIPAPVKPAKVKKKKIVVEEPVEEEEAPPAPREAAPAPRKREIVKPTFSF